MEAGARGGRMKLSTRARYAIRAMTVVAREGDDDTPINLGEVSDRTKISRRYLEQVAISLKNAGLLKAVSGKKGGHLLARPADDIRIGEIIEAAIGQINIVECVSNPEACIHLDGCECRGLYSLINQQIRETLNSYTLADLAERKIDKKIAALEK